MSQDTPTKKPPVKRKIVSASTGAEIAPGTKAAATAPVDPNAAKGRATPLRLIAVLLWILAIGAEVVAFLMLNKTIFIPKESLGTWLIVALAVDLVLVVIGSQLWKKANHIDPASKANALKFWLWNNMGVIVSVIAFVPILILMLTNKDLDPKVKKLASIVGAIALLIGIGSSYDWNPASKEDLAAAQAQASAVNEGQVFWTRFGSKYHQYEDCSTLDRSELLFQGTVAEAFEANRVALCKVCENRSGVALDPAAQVESVVTETGTETEEGVETTAAPAA